ncbi:MAG: hypothetical protein K2M95_01585 [Clostridiales bacterium]|nr:hypothetical protein [Clostridiales bacterium]
MTQENFRSSDGWLFACLSNGKLDLYHIISTGDTLNHAIFKLDEINDGLSRLESEGFIEIIGSKLKLTKKAKLFIKNHHKRFELCIPQMLRYRDVFEKMKPENEIIYKQYFSQDEYEKTIKEYCRY